MKKTFFIVLMLVLTFISCGNDKNEPNNSSNGNGQKVETPYLTITAPTNRTINYDGGSFNIKVSSNTEWICSCNSGSAVNMRTDKTKGFGDDYIRLTYDNTRDKYYSSVVTCIFTIQWKNKEGKYQYSSVEFYRNRNPH